MAYFGMMNILLLLIVLGGGLVISILTIILLVKGIKALDIYIKKNQ